MRARHVLVACLCLATLPAWCGPTLPTPSAVLFDDFNYTSPSQLASGGWITRSQPGHPGIEGARWGADALSLLNDPLRPGNHILRLQASTDGTGLGTSQAQICHARKYLEGTYAARIRFSDTPVEGPDGDVVVQSFYTVSPLRFDFDPEFSEVDWEYLPNGGWGDSRTRLYGVTWQTVKINPWQAFNKAHEEVRSVDGWHTLVMQIGQGRTRHYLDGVQLAEHGGRNYPVVPMSVNFNLWFVAGGELPRITAKRTYQQDIDWVLHVKDQLIPPQAMEALVETYRANGVNALDTVPPSAPELVSTCDF